MSYTLAAYAVFFLTFERRDKADNTWRSGCCSTHRFDLCLWSLFLRCRCDFPLLLVDRACIFTANLFVYTHGKNKIYELRLTTESSSSSVKGMLPLSLARRSIHLGRGLHKRAPLYILQNNAMDFLSDNGCVTHVLLPPPLRPTELEQAMP
ncbi:hypothetical protein BC827DRAFT_908052 [Russula dissimulans]|nr:hypothetical protein BC827DRAFT_908052 [Russula dissimulans]